MRVLEVTRDDVPKDFIILIPIGSIEQHGPHLPLGTDSIIAEYVANEVERRFCDKVLLYPTIAVGSSMEHAGFKGVTWVRFESLVHYLLDLVESTSAWGAGGVVFVNGHGGNVDALNIVVKSWNYNHDKPRALHYYIYNPRLPKPTPTIISSIRFIRHHEHGHKTETPTTVCLCFVPRGCGFVGPLGRGLPSRGCVLRLDLRARTRSFRKISQILHGLSSRRKAPGLVRFLGVGLGGACIPLYA
jgi:creatinine amidohydrolase/Fe(II)-dependent formamide hydrolase-like protein